jgi:hypothetical protein
VVVAETQVMPYLILEHNLEGLAAVGVVLLLVQEQLIKVLMVEMVGEQHMEAQTFLVVEEVQVLKDKIMYLIMVNQEELKVETEVLELHHQ